MSPGRTLAGFAVVLAALFGAGTVVGSAVNPAAPGGGDSAAHAGKAETHGAEPAEHGASSGGGHGAAAQAVRGLAVSEGGLTLRLEQPSVRGGEPATLAFSITGDDGRPVTDFEVEHEREMHFILARRDLTGFQHLHPQVDERGLWSVQTTIDQAGSYRAFADFKPGGKAYTLAADLAVNGEVRFRVLPAPATTADAGGGVTVKHTAAPAVAGGETELSFTAEQSGKPAALQQYLGAGGHLVALREGDLAFLHVHPTGGDAAAGTASFATTFPTAGRYRLFLQTQIDGRVHTAAFTQEVDAR